MPSSEDIRIAAQLISSLVLDKTTCFIWIKEQINNTAMEHFRAGKYVCEYFQTEKSFEIYEPERYVVRIDKLLDSYGNIVSDYEIHGDCITVASKGEYELRYYALPEEPKTPTDAIDMPLPYVNALKFYIAARIRARIMGQGDSNAVSFYEEYVNSVKNADLYMMRMNSRYRRMPPARRGI